MQKTFTSAKEAAEYATTKATKWISLTREVTYSDDLITICKVQDEERPVSRSDDDEFYIVTDDGEIGYTCDNGDNIDWLFTVEDAKREETKEVSPQKEKSTKKEQKPEFGGSVGFSPLINDPEVQKAKNEAKKYNIGCGVILPVVIILIFFIVSIFSDEVDIASVVFFGGGIALIVVLINLWQFFDRRKPDWEGVVTGKHVEYRTERYKDNNGNDYREKIPVSVVEFVTNDGKKKSCSTDMNNRKGGGRRDDWYTYLNIGDKVHYHSAFGTYEKYDTTKELELPCVICGKWNKITNTHCKSCKNPLLK